MHLKDWRQEQNWTLARMAEALEVGGRSPAETVRRWELGESRPDADIVARIDDVTGGLVTAIDMHSARLAYLEVKAERVA